MHECQALSSGIKLSLFNRKAYIIHTSIVLVCLSRPVRGSPDAVCFAEWRIGHILQPRRHALCAWSPSVQILGDQRHGERHRQGSAGASKLQTLGALLPPTFSSQPKNLTTQITVDLRVLGTTWARVCGRKEDDDRVSHRWLSPATGTLQWERRDLERWLQNLISPSPLGQTLLCWPFQRRKLE